MRLPSSPTHGSANVPTAATVRQRTAPSRDDRPGITLAVPSASAARFHPLHHKGSVAGSLDKCAGEAPTAYIRWLRPLLGAALVSAMAIPIAAMVCSLVVVQLAAYRRWTEVFFLQTRAGRYGKPFRIVKFRTMQPDACGVVQPTRLGALLRKTHLDELPQLWNVITGDMSLIGPRPETLDLEEWGEKEVPGFQSRLAMRPGITGMAQVVQDSTPQVAELYREKLRLNRLYQQTIGFRTDAWILFRTAVRPVRPRAFEHSRLKVR